MAQNDSLVSAKQCQSFADLAFLGLLQSRVDIGDSIEAPNSLYATEMFCSMSQTGCLVLLSQLRAAWGYRHLRMPPLRPLALGGLPPRGGLAESR